VYRPADCVALTSFLIWRPATSNTVISTLARSPVTSYANCVVEENGFGIAF
jgi:hypothetical protein